MKQRSLVIGAIISVALIVMVIIVLIIVGPKIRINNQADVENTAIEKPAIEDDEPIIATIERQVDEIEEDPEYVKTPADITQDIQEQDINIGTLIIPKINFNSEVYCKQNANKMETMPCMLYTNQGPNKPGVTIFVGHNRENGTLFSNNNLLEENDEIYFTDISGDTKRYVVYSKFVTANDDVSFYNTPSEVPILAMQCCLTANTSDQVIIILAKAEE